MKNKFLALILFGMFACQQVSADLINEVIIKGNKRISNNTIIDLIDFKKKSDYSFSDLNLFQKKLYKSNFFKDVSLKIKGNLIIINVIENPVIEFFYIDGIINKEREEKIYDKHA